MRSVVVMGSCEHEWSYGGVFDRVSLHRERKGFATETQRAQRAARTEKLEELCTRRDGEKW